ncbi:WxL protein peptidoglycan domain-containing protein [Glutamicibacter bergerei]|uniref:WxL protein peptidoglycan domain-containing protein n=2 Tax=Glutamicibacter bergerei TaxID=256702 RepID=A0ABV9MRU3_9MICC|nr:hypothetical protein [Micrococcaceae bacterium]
MISFRQVSRNAATRISAVAVTLCLVCMGAISLPAAQADDISWGINPGGDEERSSFSYELEAGDEVKDSFEITNYGTAPLELSVYGADGSTSSNGALELLPASETSSYIGQWLKVEDPQITLAAGEETEVGFTLSIPSDVAPGDYVGGMISSYINSNARSTVAVDQRLATQLAVRVAGEGAVSLSLVDIQAQTPIGWNPFAPVEGTVTATLANDGNLRARGTYTVTISGPFGLGKTSQSFESEETIPGSTVKISQHIPGIWPMFWQKVEVSMTPVGIDSLPAKPINATTTFWSVPAGWTVALLLIIAAAITSGIIRARGYEYYDDEGADELKSEKNPTSIT